MRWAPQAGRLALGRGLGYDAVQQAYAGYVYGDSTAGQKRALSARHDRHPHRQRQQQLLDRLDRAVSRRQAVESGAAECVLALGFEQMNPGALGSIYTTGRARSSEFDAVTDQLVDAKDIPMALRYFGGAGLAT